MRWVYGVTTVPSRLDTTLPYTLKTLREAGFDQPRLFIDGAENNASYQRLGLETTCRYPAVRTAHNWVLSLHELYLREPDANRFALFQDDLVICRNARKYLDTYPYGIHNESIYWNLYNFPCNEELKPPDINYGFYPSNQLGKGALALVFDRPTVIKLLSSEYLNGRPQDLNKGWQSIDGGIVISLTNIGYKEQVHYPSLVQHIGKISTMGHGEYPLSKTFPGESFDCMELLCSETGLPKHCPELVLNLHGLRNG